MIPILITATVAACLGFALSAWLTAGRVADVQANAAASCEATRQALGETIAALEASRGRELDLAHIAEREEARADALAEQLAAIRTTRSEAGRKAHQTRKARAGGFIVTASPEFTDTRIDAEVPDAA
jgi:hypothetical protein